MNSWSLLALCCATLVIAACAAIPHVRGAQGPDEVGGKASWYGEELRGAVMANGKLFDPDALTCASWHWPLGTWVRVTAGDVSVVVQVTDRGPDRGRFPKRVIDLSQAAFAKLAHPSVGLVDVTVTPLR